MEAENKSQHFSDSAPIMVERSWVSRHLWLVSVFCIAFIGLAIFGIANLWSFDLFREVREVTVQVLNENQKVRDTVGVPFKMPPDEEFKGTSRIDGFNEILQLEPFTISGLKAEAKVSGKLRRRKRGEWLPDGIIIEVQGNEPIRIPER